MSEKKTLPFCYYVFKDKDGDAVTEYLAPASPINIRTLRSGNGMHSKTILHKFKYFSGPLLITMCNFTKLFRSDQESE